MWGGLTGRMSTKKIKATATAAKIEFSANGCHTLEIQNNGSSAVYIGDSTVTTSNGIKINAGSSKIMPVNSFLDGNLYIVSSSDNDVIVADYSS